jgi:hypothetical protein
MVAVGKKRLVIWLNALDKSTAHRMAGKLPDKAKNG